MTKKYAPNVARFIKRYGSRGIAAAVDANESHTINQSEGDRYFIGRAMGVINSNGVVTELASSVSKHCEDCYNIYNRILNGAS